MAIFLTGSTGYIGAHVASLLLERHSDRLNLLVRAKTEQEANERLWRALQLHMNSGTRSKRASPFFAETSPSRILGWMRMATRTSPARPIR